MGRPKVIESRQGSTTVRIENVKSRQMLRFTVSHEPGADLEPVELPVPLMINHLRMEPADVGGVWYLLFGAQEGARRGGSGDLIGTFRCPDEGRAAFVELQQSPRCGAGGWAELVALQPNGQLRQVCWAGEKGAVSAHARDALELTGERPSARWRRRMLGAPETSV